MTSCTAHAPEPLSPADAAWLQMEHPANRLIITALLSLDGRVDEGALDDLLARVAEVPRFHQRVVRPIGLLPRLPQWRDDPRFDLRAHVHHVALPSPGGEAELRRFVGERMSAALDPEKPLWELDAIERGDGTTALLVRLHHCIGDGVALVRVLLGLTNGEGALPPEPGKRRERQVSVLGRAQELATRLTTFAGLLALPADPPTAFRRPVGVVKRAGWSRPVPLARLRALAREHHATVNDILMGTLAGVLRDSLIDAGRTLPSRDVRAMVPVFLGARNGEMGNRFGLAFLDLPVGEPDETARIRTLKQRMDAIKSSLVAPVAFDVLQAFGMAGSLVERAGVEIFTRKATLMVTNVPGPKTPLRIAGRGIEGMMVWAPTSGRLGFSVTLLSYNGELRIGVTTDAHIDVDPQALVDRFHRALSPPAPRPEQRPQPTA